MKISWELLLQMNSIDRGFVDLTSGMIYEELPSQSNIGNYREIPAVTPEYVEYCYLSEKGLLAEAQRQYDVDVDLLRKRIDTVFVYGEDKTYTDELCSVLSKVHAFIDGSGRLNEFSEFCKRMISELMKKWCEDSGFEPVSIPYLREETLYLIGCGINDLSLL